MPWIENHIKPIHRLLGVIAVCGLFFSTFFILISILLGCLTPVAAQNTDAGESGINPLVDYLEQVTLFSDGRITRFTRMPIRVHISPTFKALPYLTEIRYAMRTWGTASEGRIRFQETETLEQADIRVISTDTARLRFLDTRLGSAELTRLKGSHQQLVGQEQSAGAGNTQPPQTPKTENQFTVEVILVLAGDGTTGELTQEEMRTVCLHEFGHAIGLWGHSPDPLDVCHAMATAQYPTQRDIDTLLKLYSTPLHTSQHEIAIHQLKKEIQTNPMIFQKSEVEVSL